MLGKRLVRVQHGKYAIRTRCIIVYAHVMRLHSYVWQARWDRNECSCMRRAGIEFHKVVRLGYSRKLSGLYRRSKVSVCDPYARMCPSDGSSEIDTSLALRHSLSVAFPTVIWKASELMLHSAMWRRFVLDQLQMYVFL